MFKVSEIIGGVKVEFENLTGDTETVVLICEHESDTLCRVICLYSTPDIPEGKCFRMEVSCDNDSTVAFISEEEINKNKSRLASADYRRNLYKAIIGTEISFIDISHVRNRASIMLQLIDEDEVVDCAVLCTINSPKMYTMNSYRLMQDFIIHQSLDDIEHMKEFI